MNQNHICTVVSEHMGSAWVDACHPVVYMPHTLQDCVCVLAHMS